MSLFNIQLLCKVKQTAKLHNSKDLDVNNFAALLNTSMFGTTIMLDDFYKLGYSQVLGNLAIKVGTYSKVLVFLLFDISNIM